MRTIPLHSKKYPDWVALIDDIDFELVSKYRWNPHKSRNGVFYARSTTGEYMHRLLCSGSMIDHIDRNGLNNTRENLRPCDHSLNGHNAAISLGKSKYRGVYYDGRPERKTRWVARISIRNKRLHLGYFATEEEAADACMAARKSYGL